MKLHRALDQKHVGPIVLNHQRQSPSTARFRTLWGFSGIERRKARVARAFGYREELLAGRVIL